MAFDAERNDLVPETKGIVRGSVSVSSITKLYQLGGWKLEPVEGEPNKTRCSYQVELDLKGNIPGFVIKQANKDQGYQIVLMRKVVEKFLRE